MAEQPGLPPCRNTPTPTYREEPDPDTLRSELGDVHTPTGGCEAGPVRRLGRGQDCAPSPIAFGRPAFRGRGISKLVHRLRHAPVAVVSYSCAFRMRPGTYVWESVCRAYWFRVLWLMPSKISISPPTGQFSPSVQTDQRGSGRGIARLRIDSRVNRAGQTEHPYGVCTASMTHTVPMS